MIRRDALGGHLFVYGSLMDREVLEGVIGHAHRGQRLRARLNGYEKVAVAGWDYPALVPRAEAHTEGVLITDLSEPDLQRLDRYEEVTEGVYRRAAVTAEVWQPGPTRTRVAAQTYVAGPVLLNRLAAGPRTGNGSQR
jgi:gamma-glutamylcyclotransferase (GGCT)/AIG2-like uncharacterized protein YtfP